MKLSENPIFLTQKRLVHREGVLAAVIIAAVLGFCLLLGLGNDINSKDFRLHSSPQESGRVFYGWIIGLQVLVLIIGGFGRISRSLADDRKAGLWDSNRLTPLKPADLVTGYWFGPVLREFYMALVLAGFGLLIVLTAGLPLGFWLATQILIAGTALFYGLLGVLAGMAFQRSQGLIIILLILFACPFSFLNPSRTVTNFLLPVYGFGRQFSGVVPPAVTRENNGLDWVRMPDFFGISVHPVILSLVLQGVIGLFVWRSLTRKTARPFEPLLLRWEAVTLFAMLLFSQHGLMWSVWHGKFPAANPSGAMEGVAESLLPMVHGGAILVGVLLLVFASPQPEHVRVESLRLGFRNLGAVFSRSSVSLAIMLAGAAAAGMLTQFAFAPAGSFRIYFATTVSLAEILAAFALLLEFCRIRHGRRALGFLVLWLLVLCFLPLILAGIFNSDTVAYFSLLAPGFVAQGFADPRNPDHDNWPLLAGILAGQMGIVVLLGFAWARQWKALLNRAA